MLVTLDLPRFTVQEKSTSHLNLRRWFFKEVRSGLKNRLESLRLHLRRCRSDTFDVCYRLVHEDSSGILGQPWNARWLVLPRSTCCIRKFPFTMLRCKPTSLSKPMQVKVVKHCK